MNQISTQASTRSLDLLQFRNIFERYITGGEFNEDKSYYPRYKSRYEFILNRICRLTQYNKPVSILDIGGGQISLLANKLWGDAASVLDIGGSHLDYLRSEGVAASQWNLFSDPPIPELASQFDIIVLSEVIEHIPLPGSVVMEKVSFFLKPSGTIILTTPNLYRWRNIVYMLFGKPILDHFQYPSSKGLGHVIEYTVDHLTWQVKKAGLAVVCADIINIRHVPKDTFMAILYFFGTPLQGIKIHKELIYLECSHGNSIKINYQAQ